MSELLRDPSSTVWTAADLVERFGAVPLNRIRLDPAPGTATEGDVQAIHLREDRLYELVDQTLLEKTVGTYEALLAATLVRLLGNFVAARDLGIVLGPDGMIRLSPGLVRIPDVSYVSWERLPKRALPDQPIADFVPNLAVEVLSRGNTREEMQRKLHEYVRAGVQQVWYVDPPPREVHVYTATDQCQTMRGQQSIDGGELLPGFSLPLPELFVKSAI
jgi:Uma2 family endonuclease